MTRLPRWSSLCSPKATKKRVKSQRGYRRRSFALAIETLEARRLLTSDIAYLVNGVEVTPNSTYVIDLNSVQTNSTGTYVSLTIRNDSVYTFEQIVASSVGVSMNGLDENYVLSDKDWTLDPSATYDIQVYFDPSKTYYDSNIGVQMYIHGAMFDYGIGFQYVPNYPVTFTDLTSQTQGIITEQIGIEYCGCGDLGITQATTMVLTFEAKVDAAIDFSDDVRVTVNIGGITSSQIATLSSTSTATQPTIERFTFTFDPSVFTGLESVDYTATLSEVTPDAAPSHEMLSTPDPVNGHLLIPTDEITINAVPRLIFGDDGVLFNEGIWAGYYAEDGLGGYLSAPGTFSTLVAVTGGYELTDRDGNVIQFDSQGYAISMNDTKGRVTTYSYIAYGAEKLLASIADAFLTTSFTYSSGKLIEASNTHGGWVSLAYTSDLLTTVTGVDPDGAGALPSDLTTYTYDSNDRLQTKTKNGLTSTYTYDSTGRLASVETPEGTTTTYVSPEQSAVTIDDPVGTITDDRSISIQYQQDSLGNITQKTDALGNVTRYERDANGLLLKMTFPDPDGVGPLEASVFEYTYDSRGNMLTETLPDDSVRTWVYHATWNQPIQYTNANGNIALYTYDNTYEYLLTETAVIGEIDDLVNLETDDLTSTYTYTPAPTLSTDAPIGLVASITDPDSVVTEFTYNSKHWPLARNHICPGNSR